MEKSFARILATLLCLFVFRVSAQLIQQLIPVPWLPSFESWHSASIPYWLLVMAQLIIIALAAKIIHGLWTGTRKSSPHRGKVYLWLGGCYFLGMAFRFVSGQTFLANHSWFSAWLPALFHLVLAVFVIVNGISHLKIKST